MLEDAGGLLDEAAALLGRGRQDGVELALADDHVHLAADAGVGEQLLDVEQAAGLAVDRVLGAAVAEHGPRDRDLGVVDRQRAVGVVDGEDDLGAAQRRAAGGAGEDDVLHLAAAQRLGALLAHDPGEGVDDVGLAGAVGPDDAGDARLEAQGGRRREGLEAAQGQALQMHAEGSRPGRARWSSGRAGKTAGQPTGRDAVVREAVRRRRPADGRSVRRAVSVRAGGDARRLRGSSTRSRPARWSSATRLVSASFAALRRSTSSSRSRTASAERVRAPRRAADRVRRGDRTGPSPSEVLHTSGCRGAAPMARVVLVARGAAVGQRAEAPGCRACGAVDQGSTGVGRAARRRCRRSGCGPAAARSGLTQPHAPGLRDVGTRPHGVVAGCAECAA